MADKLTKADTVALWHAVQWMAICVKQGGADDQGLDVERQRLAAAKRALRKVNAIRKAADGVPASCHQVQPLPHPDGEKPKGGSNA